MARLARSSKSESERDTARARGEVGAKVFRNSASRASLPRSRGNFANLPTLRVAQRCPHASTYDPDPHRGCTDKFMLTTDSDMLHTGSKAHRGHLSFFCVTEHARAGCLLNGLIGTRPNASNSAGARARARHSPAFVKLPASPALRSGPSPRRELGARRGACPNGIYVSFDSLLALLQLPRRLNLRARANSWRLRGHGARVTSSLSKRFA